MNYHHNTMNYHHNINNYYHNIKLTTEDSDGIPYALTSYVFRNLHTPCMNSQQNNFFVYNIMYIIMYKMDYVIQHKQNL